MYMTEMTKMSWFLNWLKAFYHSVRKPQQSNAVPPHGRFEKQNKHTYTYSSMFCCKDWPQFGFSTQCSKLEWYLAATFVQSERAMFWELKMPWQGHKDGSKSNQQQQEMHLVQEVAACFNFKAGPLYILYGLLLNIDQMANVLYSLC